MESYFKKYRPFLLFLGKFLLTYLVFIFLYQCYLNQFDSAKFESDGFTAFVSNNTKSLLEFFNYKVNLLAHEREPSFKVYVENKYVVRIVEGCNAISVMILFAAFVVAFSGKFLKTVLFIIFGIILIHLLNVCRIAVLSLGILYYPEYEGLLHDIVFPLFIYGVVFALWVIWINKFSLYAKKNPST